MSTPYQHVGLSKLLANSLLGKHAKRDVALFMVGATAYAVLCSWPLLVRAPGFGLVPVLVCVAFCATLLVLKDEVGRGGSTSLLLVVVGLLWPTNHLYEWGGPLLTRLSMMGSSIFWWTAAWACLLYPQQRLGVIEKSYLILLGIGLGVPDIYLLALGKTYQDIPYFTDLFPLLGIGFLFVALIRFRRYQGVQCRTLTPVLISGALLALSGGVSWSVLVASGIYTSTAEQKTIDITYCVQGLLLLLMAPVGFIVAGLRRRFIQGAVAEALVRLRPGPTLEEVRQGLRDALGDDRLDILYWSPHRGNYIDATGSSIDTATAPADQVRIPLRTGGPEQLALLVVDGQLAREVALFEDSVCAPQAPVLMAWIQAHDRAYQEQQRALHRRLEEARWKERQRLGRDLHDGVQQQLYALQLRLAQVDRLADDSQPIQQVIDQSRQQLREVLSIFRKTVQGFAPIELQHGGLASALHELIEQQPISVESRIAPARCPLATELVAYYIACEAFTNITKHAQASRVLVEISLMDNALLLVIADNGRGGADMRAGTGLAGLHDRVEAIGGELNVDSPPGTGTELIARIPCV